MVQVNRVCSTIHEHGAVAVAVAVLAHERRTDRVRACVCIYALLIIDRVTSNCSFGCVCDRFKVYTDALSLYRSVHRCRCIGYICIYIERGVPVREARGG